MAEQESGELRSEAGRQQPVGQGAGSVAASVARPPAAGRTRGCPGTSGFTLVELLVVVAIIGILAAIAIPAFASYRARAYNADAVSALANLARAEEAYYIQNGSYTTAISSLPPYYPPAGVVMQVTSATTADFTAEAYHPGGDRTFQWSSGAGGLQP